MFKSLLMPIAILVAAPATGKESAPVLPDWMAGCWLDRRGEDWSEECWMRPRGGMMLGSSRSGAGERVTEWELMRIETDVSNGDGTPTRMAFLAAPGGRGWTTFPWNGDAGKGVTFASPANDYPQRIRYWREGKFLKGEISMLDGSRAKQWTFTPVER